MNEETLQKHINETIANEIKIKAAQPENNTVSIAGNKNIVGNGNVVLMVSPTKSVKAADDTLLQPEQRTVLRDWLKRLSFMRAYEEVNH